MSVDTKQTSPNPSDPAAPQRVRVKKTLANLPYPVASTVAIAFSLTLMAAGTAVATGAAQVRFLSGAERIDVSAALLFAPLCALVLAMVFEAARLAMQGPLAPLSVVPHRRPLAPLPRRRR